MSSQVGSRVEFGTLGRVMLFTVLALSTASNGDMGERIVPLHVENASAWAREAAPVSFGVPFPRELGIRSEAGLGLIDSSGQPVPVQGTVLSRWSGAPDDSTKPIKWILLDFQATVPARDVRKYTLVRGGRSAAPAVAVHVAEDRTRIEISTGVATFRISRERFSVFDEIRLRSGDTGDLVVAQGRESDGLYYQDQNSRSFHAGRPDSARVEILGPLHVVVGVRGRFVDESGQAGFLYYVARYHFHAGHREARLLLTVTDRHDRPLTEGQWDKRWDTQQVADLRLALSLAQPVRSVLLPRSDRANAVEKYHLAGERAHLRLTQLSPHSYRLALGVDNGELEQKGHMEVSGFWLPRTDWRGFQGGDFLSQDADGGRSSVRWVAPIPEPGRYKVAVSLPEVPGFARYLTAKGVTYDIRSSAGVETRILDQGSIGWASLGIFQFADRAEVTMRATGSGKLMADALRVQPADEKNRSRVAVVDRDRAAGWTYALASRVGIGVGLTDFWQNAPKELLIAENGRTEIGLLPEGPHHFMGGLGKTHEIVFSPRTVGPGGTPDANGNFLEPPLHAIAPADWYARTGAVGYGPVHGERGTTPEGREYETLVERAIDPERPSLLTEIERRNWYGWRNYGDFEIGMPYWSPDGAVEDWANGMMDYASGLLIQYLRTGRAPYWTLGRAAVWHLADIGLVKFHPFDPKSNGTVHRKGECLRSRSHVCQDPIAGQAFAHRSLLLLYQLTGDSWLLETAMMNVDYAYNLSVPRVARPYFLSAAGRDLGWILGALLTGYEQSGESRYLELAKQLFERKVVAQFDPATGAIINPGVDDEYAAMAPMLQPWMIGYTGDALIYYHAITGDKRAVDMVVGLARFLRDFGVRRSRLPAKGEPGYTSLIPDELAGKSPQYVLYSWTYERQRARARVSARHVNRSTLLVEYLGERPARPSDLRGKLLFITTGAAAGKPLLISSASDGVLSVECRRGTEGRCSNDLERHGVRPGDTAVILQADEYRVESVTYNFVTLNTLAFATRHTGDSSYLELARELFAYASALLNDQGFQGPRQASDYLTFPHAFLALVSRAAK